MNRSEEAWAFCMTILTVGCSVQYYRQSSGGLGPLFLGLLFSCAGAVLGIRILSIEWSSTWSLIAFSNVVCLVMQVYGIWRDFANSPVC